MPTVATEAEIVSVVRLTDEVLNAKAVESAWAMLDKSSLTVLRLDLGRVRFPTAEGLGALLRLNKGLRARGGGLVLFNVSADVYEVFEKTALIGVFDMR
jgi:anti-anti-sigma factor